MALLFQQTDGRRKILKGRKTITRTYYSKFCETAKSFKLQTYF